MLSNLRYSNGEYEIKYTRYPNHRRYRVQLSSDPDYHTHMRTLKEAVDLANFAKYQEIPDKASLDYLESLLRVVRDEKFRKKIRRTMDRRYHGN